MPLWQLPGTCVRRNVGITTSGITSGPALRMAIDMPGLDCVQLAGDYPCEDVAGDVEFHGNAQQSAAERKAVFETSAAQFRKFTAQGSLPSSKA